MQKYFVYILFNQSRTLYVGMTNDLIRRVGEHRAGKVPGFTAKYRMTMLAHYEVFPAPIAAIEREKQIKGWTRAKKIALVETWNPHWEDLSNHLVERFPMPEVAGEMRGFDVPSQILRCAQDDSFRPLSRKN